MEAKPKLTEERLQKLAMARKKALEVKKMKGDIARAKKQEKKEALEKEYEEVVVKKTIVKKTPQKGEAPPCHRQVEIPLEETDKEVYEVSRNQGEVESEEDDISPPPPPPPKSKKVGDRESKANTIVQHPAPAPNYKQMYYQHKLSMLQQKQEEERIASQEARLHEQFKQQYARLPPYAHTIDIAKQSIKERVDKTIYDQVYKQLFSS